MRTQITGLLLLLAIGCVGVHTDPMANPDPDAMPGPDAEPQPVIVHEPKKMFVTSAVYQGGSLGGLEGADAKCASHAEAGGLTGIYKAWLSTKKTSAKTRLTHSTAAYSLVNGTVIAANWEDLVSSNLMAGVNIDEDGQVYARTEQCMTKIGAWSATRFGSVLPTEPTDYTCGGWTSVTGNGGVGQIGRSDHAWSDSGCAGSCGAKFALYCVEQ